jgi:alpha-L-fucosidase
MLTDIVSKNGNLMLNIPLRGDGSPDEKELAFLAGLTAWMDVNSEGIYATRPWKIYGEGPSTTARPAARGAGRGSTPAYTAEDIRFTTKADTLYAFVGAWPESRSVVIKSLGNNSPQVADRKIVDVSLLGYSGKLDWSQTNDGLTVKLPDKASSEHAVTLRIKGLLA